MFKSLIDKTVFFVVRGILFPFGFLPQKTLFFLGRQIGSVLYYLLPRYRKRCLSNLALAKKLKLSEAQLKKTAKEAMQNLSITCLEFAKLKQIKDLSKLVSCKNPETALTLVKEGRGIVFFVAHQANWELLFLEGTTRMPGVAIGRPIKNPYLYNWIRSIRERFNGKIIEPKNALKGGLRALKQGKFLGIVGDQGMPDSPYSSDFLGRKAYTSSAPALLAIKANVPIIVATIKRLSNRYEIEYSEPIFPNLQKPVEEETHRLMSFCLNSIEKSIEKNPGQWLWQHNRWKQEAPKNVYYRFRYDSILVILPNSSFVNEVKTLRMIYPKAYITLLVPQERKEEYAFFEGEIIHYTTQAPPFIHDYRFKFIFDLSDQKKLSKKYLKLSAFEVLTKQDLAKWIREHRHKEPPPKLQDQIVEAICRKEVFPNAS